QRGRACRHRRLRRRGGAGGEGDRGGLLGAAFGRRDNVAGLRRGRGQRGGEHALRVGGAGGGAEMIATAAARQRHRGVRNQVAVGILHRHRHRGGRHPVGAQRGRACRHRRLRRRGGAGGEGDRGGLLGAAFGRRDNVAGLRRGRGQRGGEHALRVGGAGG